MPEVGFDAVASKAQAEMEAICDKFEGAREERINEQETLADEEVNSKMEEVLAAYPNIILISQILDKRTLVDNMQADGEGEDAEGELC
jgi:hypothetical protein